MWLVVLAFPSLHGDLVKSGTHFATVPVNSETIALSVLAGATMTLLTRMHHGTDDMVAKIAAAIASFLLASTQMFHSILDSLLILGAIHTGDALRNSSPFPVGGGGTNALSWPADRIGERGLIRHLHRPKPLVDRHRVPTRRTRRSPCSYPFDSHPGRSPVLRRQLGALGGSDWLRQSQRRHIGPGTVA